MLLQGGFDTGRTSTDNCEVVAKVDNPSTQFCHVDTAFLTQVKLLGSYTVPKVVLDAVPSGPVYVFVSRVASTRATTEPDRGVVLLRSETRNQRGEVVQVLKSKLVVRHKPQNPAPARAMPGKRKLCP